MFLLTPGLVHSSTVMQQGHVHDARAGIWVPAVDCLDELAWIRALGRSPSIRGANPKGCPLRSCHWAWSGRDWNGRLVS